MLRSDREPLPTTVGPPAHRDYWHGLNNLVPKVTHDRAFHVAVVGERVYLGSYVSDKIYCLDAAGGSLIWDFFTGGPVRCAPTVADGRLYAGSDDGWVYCLAAHDGSLLWKHHAGEGDAQVWGDGRLVSRSPVRTGVLVENGTAYCCAGLFPSEGVFLCALNAVTGGTGTGGYWKKAVAIAPQGYLLATASALYVPTSRTSPVIYDRSTGDYRGAFAGKGGTFALLTDDSFLYGPNLQGTVDEYPKAAGDRIATFQGLQMVVTADMSYLVSEESIAALDRVTRKTVWRRAESLPFSLILAGDVLFAGGESRVAALRASDGEECWSAAVPGKAYGLAVASGRLFVSTDRGSVFCFADSTVRDPEKIVAAQWTLF